MEEVKSNTVFGESIEAVFSPVSIVLRSEKDFDSGINLFVTLNVDCISVGLMVLSPFGCEVFVFVTLRRNAI